MDLFSKGSPFCCILHLSAPNEGKRAEVLAGALGLPKYPVQSQSPPVRDAAKLGGARQTTQALSACCFECSISSSSDNLELTPIQPKGDEDKNSWNGNHRKRTREVLDVSSMEVYKAKLDGTLSI